MGLALHNWNIQGEASSIRVVEQAIQSATETAVMILRIDDVISSKGVSMGDEMGDMGDFHM